MVSMGDIIKYVSGITSIYIERRVDKTETQKLRFDLTESWLGTETGNSIRLFGRNDASTIEIEIPISISELKEALEKIR